MDFIFEQIRTGGDRNLGYLLGARGAKVAFAVDPSFSPDLFEERAAAQGCRITHVLNTHGHGDHTNGNVRIIKRTGAALVAYPGTADGSELFLGPYRMRILHLPGHSPDHVVFHLAEQKVAITGDLLFVGKIGGTEREEDARIEHASLLRLLRALPDETTIWPGHDYGCRPSSTIALEKASNPFLGLDLDRFLALKRDWSSFKAEHGLR